MTERSARADGGASPRQVPVYRTRSRQGFRAGTPNKSTLETRRSLRSEVPDGPSSTRGQEPSTSVGGSFCFAGALRDGVVYSAWFNKSEFIKENIDETIFMFALFKCRKSDKGRN